MWNGQTRDGQMVVDSGSARCIPRWGIATPSSKRPDSLPTLCGSLQGCPRGGAETHVGVGQTSEAGHAQRFIIARVITGVLNGRGECTAGYRVRKEDKNP